jgi:S-adenosylmethionine:tRNA ribosyltransferase-isomerase
MKQAYAHAIASGYRFYSYGDACLLFRAHEWRGIE